MMIAMRSMKFSENIAYDNAMMIVAIFLSFFRKHAHMRPVKKIAMPKAGITVPKRYPAVFSTTSPGVFTKKNEGNLRDLPNLSQSQVKRLCIGVLIR